MLRMGKSTDPIQHCSGKIMVCGHTRQRNGLTVQFWFGGLRRHRAWMPEGWLTCLDVDAGRYWQADQQGRRRQGVLKEGSE